MNLLYDSVGPCAPIRLRPKIVLVPRRPLQQRAAITQCRPELPPPGAHVVAQDVRRRDLRGAQLAHDRRLRRDLEGQQPLVTVIGKRFFIPHGDRLHEILRSGSSARPRVPIRQSVPRPGTRCQRGTTILRERQAAETQLRFSTPSTPAHQS